MGKSPHGKLAVRREKLHRRNLGKERCMAEDVEIPFERMEELSNALGDIITEFEEAADQTGDLIDAIDVPVPGYTGLQSRASDFESLWRNKRETLRRKLVEMTKRVEENRQPWKDLDEELSTMAEGEG
jgi:hypothetical protein